MKVNEIKCHNVKQTLFKIGEGNCLWGYWSHAEENGKKNQS